MPIFEYVCQECGAKFEKIVASSSVKAVCTQCSSTQVERLLSVFAVSAGSSAGPSSESGPCACGAPRRGMCGE